MSHDVTRKGNAVFLEGIENNKNCIMDELVTSYWSERELGWEEDFLLNFYVLIFLNYLKKKYKL